jgi:fructokinase
VSIGVDLGGTKIEIVACAEADLGRIENVGVGTPGAISPETGLLQNSNSTVLNGKPLANDIERRLDRPIRMANDANCFALSEAIDGAGASFQVVFGVILGTGVGGGIVVARSVISGRNNIAGEWGHNPLPWSVQDEQPGPICYCGKHGCLETFLSGPGLSRQFFITTGRDLTAAEISGAADAGEDDASPPALMANYVFSKHVDVNIVPALHGDSSGVRGAARLWP